MRNKILIILGTVVMLSAVGANPVHACADGPDTWRVKDVASNDVLNVRSGPGLGFGVIGTLPYYATNLQNLDRVPITCDSGEHLNSFERKNFWTKIVWKEEGKFVIGWVKQRFLSE